MKHNLYPSYFARLAAMAWVAFSASCLSTESGSDCGSTSDDSDDSDDSDADASVTETGGDGEEDEAGSAATPEDGDATPPESGTEEDGATGDTEDAAGNALCEQLCQFIDDCDDDASECQEHCVDDNEWAADQSEECRDARRAFLICESGLDTCKELHALWDADDEDYPCADEDREMDEVCE